MYLWACLLTLLTALPLLNAVSAIENNSPPLCAPPTQTQDNVFIDCKLEYHSPTNLKPSKAANVNDLRTIAYNIDRNGDGGDGSKEGGLTPIISLLEDYTVVGEWDVLFLSEVSRGCNNWDEGSNGAQEIADHFGFYSIYGVEYVEINQGSRNGECSIGNAIVSRYPLTNSDWLVFESQCCRYDGRWGGRSAVKSEIVIPSLTGDGKGRQFNLVSTHLESGQGDFMSVVKAKVVRGLQVTEMAEKYNSGGNGALTIIAGDMNGPLRELDSTRIAFQLDGMTDCHYYLPWADRNTCPDCGVISEYGLQTLDFIYVSDEEAISGNPGQCNDAAKCNGLSDHIPVWSSFKFGFGKEVAIEVEEEEEDEDENIDNGDAGQEEEGEGGGDEEESGDDEKDGKSKEEIKDEEEECLPWWSWKCFKFNYLGGCGAISAAGGILIFKRRQKQNYNDAQLLLTRKPKHKMVKMGKREDGRERERREREFTKV